MSETRIIVIADSFFLRSDRRKEVETREIV